MLHKSAAITVALLFVAGSALAAPDKKAPKSGKVTQVNVCPITGEAAKGNAGGTEKVDNYNVHFCCPSCKPAFDKLSKKDKVAKIHAAMKGKKTSKAETSLTAVNVCPITGEKVVGEGGGSVVCGKYEVHFCCAGCKPAFERLSASEKEAKIQEILKKS